jgi:predicted class III extradiol MEMO1 family dioxygenase
MLLRLLLDIPVSMPFTHTHTPPVPLTGPLVIDQDIYAELKATGEFEMMRLAVDEAEHSLELHTPYIARVLR